MKILYFAWLKNKTGVSEEIINDDSIQDIKSLLKFISEKYPKLKEFIIEDSGYGNWLVNVKSLNTTPGTNPTFLKYTLYQNYGLPNEKKEVKVLNLAQHTEKVTLDTFIY